MFFLFWMAAGLMVAHYWALPLYLWTAATLFPRRTETGRAWPTVALVIAAYNEAKVIERKLKNCKELSYPSDKFEVIVVSDGSTDETPQIVERIGGARSLFQKERKGKADALNRAVASTQADVVVFSDANTFYNVDAIVRLVQHFADPRVGGVSGLKRIQQKRARASARGDQTYWNLESLIKIWESAIGSVSTGDGEIFAIRRGLFKPLDSAIINDDMAITLEIVSRGYRVLYEPEAISEEEASITLREDFNVKARMVAGGYQFFSRLLNNSSVSSGFRIQLFIHKFLRYFMPVLLITLFIANLFLLRTSFYWMALLMQVTVYFSAMIGVIFTLFKISPSLFYLPLYYCVVNAAALKGLVYFLRRIPVTVVWTKANR